jgi:hypothetical protein|tara:strand:- start:154 stop:492 length:339 start_codon:yes stop_codon:yes gene_type:complete
MSNFVTDTSSKYYKMNVDDLMVKKKRLSLERDLCAEMYNLMLSKANANINNEDKHKYYLDVVELMEPYAKETKEEIREINRQICKLVGRDTLKDTIYNLECEDRYGLSKPEL